jgi:hypothetical protein
MYKDFNYSNGMFKVTILDKNAQPVKVIDKNTGLETVIGEQTFALNSNKNSKVLAGIKSSKGDITHIAFKVSDKAAVESEIAMKELYLVADQIQVSTDGIYAVAMARPIKKFEF